MIPKGTQGIAHLTTRLLVDLLPKASDDYMMADLALMAEATKMVGQDYDRAVDVLVADHEALMDIFRDAATHLSNSGLKQRVVAAMGYKTASLRVSDLDVRGDIEMRVLIDLHQAVEESLADGAEWAAQMNQRIWIVLDDWVERRIYQSDL